MSNKNIEIKKWTVATKEKQTLSLRAINKKLNFY